MKNWVYGLFRAPAIVAILLASCGCAPLAPTRSGGAETSAVLAIFEATADGYLEQAAECQNPNVVCLDPPPVRFRASTLEWIHGRGTAPRFDATTTDHFGVESYLFQSALPKLGLFLRQDGHITLPRNAWTVVWRDREGEWWTPAGAWFLPCSIKDLVEPLQVTSLDQGSLADACPGSLDSTTRLSGGVACQHETLEAIRTSRLRDALSVLQPAEEDWFCGRDANDASNRDANTP